MTYDLAGRLTSITRPNGTYRTLSYDAAGAVDEHLGADGQRPAHRVVPVQLESELRPWIGNLPRPCRTPMRRRPGR